METGRPAEIEKHIHKILAHRQYDPEHRISGGTEMFVGVNEFRVIQYLRNCNDNLFDKPLELSDNDYKHLGQLISP